MITLAVNVTPSTGVQVQLADEDVQYAISIARGRSTFSDQGSPSSLRLNILLGPPNDPTYLQGVTIGNQISVALVDGAAMYHGRFTGQITDLTLQHPTDLPAYAEVMAVGTLAQINGRSVGYTDFPEQDVRLRAMEVGDRVGVPIQVNTDGTAPTLTTYKAENQRAAYVLSDAATAVGAIVFDTADGEVIFQQHADRANLQGAMTPHGLWQDNPQPWKSTPGSWIGYVSGGVAPTLTLPCDAVLYEPTWQQFSGSLVNSITVKYAGGDVSVIDSASQALYGQRSAELSTSLADKDDAIDRAADISRAFGTPRWMMNTATILMEKLPADLFDDLTSQEIIGRRVRITDLPQPAPASTFTGICEGVQEDYSPGSWRMTLALSPQQFSYAMLAWEEPDPSVLWQHARCSWEQAIRLDDLTRSA